MRILQVSTSDGGGGAEGSAWKLFQAYRDRGYNSFLAVGTKYGHDKNVVTIPNDELRGRWTRFWISAGKVLLPGNLKFRGVSRLRRLVQRPGYLGKVLNKARGYEDFDFPGTWSLLNLAEQPPDVLHCHNLHGQHGGYFDLRALPWLSRQVPVILNLRDCWLLSGHCAHSFDCDRWQSGCGKCPDLSIYPPIHCDATSFNWRRKQQIFSESRLYLTTPSKWLMERVEKSMLTSGIVMKRVVPNGVDLSIFKPANGRWLVRKNLDLPVDAKIVMFAAYGIRKNIWKDYKTMKAAVNLVSETMKDRQLIFLALGEKAKEERIGKAIIRFIPYQRDPNLLAQFYQAADLYIHAALAETFSNTIAEAKACATPVVATNTGAVPEQITDGIMGFLTPSGDPTAMAEKIRILLEDDSLRLRMGKAGAEDVRVRFSLEHQVDQFLDWYSEVIDDWKSWRSTNSV